MNNETTNDKLQTINDKRFLNCGGTLLDLSSPLVMCILNITPDSFFDGGKYNSEKIIIEHVQQMIAEGAAIIDVGAQSTRPKSELVSGEEETSRLLPVMNILKKEFPGQIFSVDTFYADVAERSVDAGAQIINDISGGTMDEKMFATIARLKVPYMLMHIQGTPQTMQQNPHYENVTKEVMDFFIERIYKLRSLGVSDIIIDPGFGFGKTLEHNFTLLNDLGLFKMLDCPIMAGLSRKSMINKTLGIKPEDALNGTTVLNTIALMKGANILRVHDVKEAVEAVRLANKLQK